MRSKNKPNYKFPFFLKAALLSLLLYTGYIKEKNLIESYVSSLITRTDITVLITGINP